MAKPKIPIVLGAGVVANAWRPVLRAVATQRGHSVTEDQANTYLAKLVYQVRMMCDSERKGRASAADLARATAKLHQVRETIASEIRLSEASGELMIRAEFDRVLDRFGPREGEGLLAYNLNWDRVADGALSRWGDARSQRADPVHLHGQATNSSELYLPSEVHFEPYRSSEGQQSLFHQQAALVNAEPLGDRLILYGLSLDPLDAELCTTVALLLHESSIQKIILVNPNHSVVAERLRLFLDDGRHRAVIGIDPAYLSIHSRYDVRWGVPSDSV